MGYGYDLVGTDELLSGADDLDDVLGAYDLIGRRAVAKARRAGAMRNASPAAANAAAAAALARNAGILQERSPVKLRKLYAPLGATSVASLASANVTANPQTIAFKPTRLVVPATIAPDFTIDAITIGNKPQSVVTGSAPAEAFVANAMEEMDMDTVQTSQQLVTAVTNISGATRTFRGLYFGRSAD